MTARSIVTLPHKVLRGRAHEVSAEEITGAKVRRLISDMKAILAAAADGVGLAAPQVGEPLQLFMVSEEARYVDARKPGTNMRMNTDDTDTKRRWEYFVFANPKLIKKSQKKKEMMEGCLSIPRRFGAVNRAEKIMLSWLDEHGRKHSRGFTGFFARVIQHELDHLDGVLITDKAKKIVAVNYNHSVSDTGLDNAGRQLK